MIGSVRTRLTVGISLTVGVIALAAALVGPAIVRQTLIDDRLDGEIAREQGTINPLDLPDDIADWYDIDEWANMFGPELQAASDTLDAAGALAPLRALRPDGDLVVMIVPRLTARLDGSSSITFERDDDSIADEPVITWTRLSKVVSTFVPETGYDPLVDALDERAATSHEQETPRGDDLVYGVRTVDNHQLILTASTDGIVRSVDRVRSGLWATVPLAMMLTAALTWLIAGRALRPVRAITEQTSRVRSSTLHERVPVPPANDEIAGLANEMNTMLDRIQQEDARRRQFVADASHELRSPIATIRTQAEVAVATANSPETHELADGVLAEAERLSGIVDDLLALARHDEGPRLPGRPVDLDDLVLAEARRPRRVPIDTRAVSAGRVVGRVDELSRMVTHLLDNAARHADTIVKVTLRSDEDSVVLAVDDDGPGVPDAERARVFERFVRLDEARRRDQGGAGLGLAVVASTAAASGGSVEVDDSELGGARFVVRLPQP